MQFNISHKRYLILGADGYVGAELLKLLVDNGHGAIGVTGKAFRLKQIPLDSCKYDDLIVVNCAFWDGSVGGSFDVADYLDCLSSYGGGLPCAFHVFFSSSSVYEDTIRAQESSPLNRSSRYAVCKLAVELFYQSQFSRFAIFRLGQVIGTTIKRKTFFDHVLRNMESESAVLSLKRCNARLSPTLTSTISESLICLEQRHSNKIFNISSNLNLTSYEFVQKLAQETSIYRQIQCSDTGSYGNWMDVSKAQEEGLLQDSPDDFKRICKIFTQGMYR